LDSIPFYDFAKRKGVHAPKVSGHAPWRLPVVSLPERMRNDHVRAKERRVHDEVTVQVLCKNMLNLQAMIDLLTTILHIPSEHNCQAFLRISSMSPQHFRDNEKQREKLSLDHRCGLIFPQILLKFADFICTFPKISLMFAEFCMKYADACLRH
jgi:hypothetical protein